MMDEYISREDVCLQLEKQESIDGQPRAIRRARRIVANSPAADVRPVVRGKWVRLDMHKGMEQFRCSICRSECYVPTCMGEPMYEFCPNCGADMREG